MNWHPYYVEYDSANNVVEEITAWQDLRQWFDAFGAVYTHNAYGPHGNVVTQKVVRNYNFPGYIYQGTTTTSYYNGSKYFQKESVTDPDGHTTTFDYFEKTDSNPGNRGQVKWVRDARYGTTGEQFDYTYNSYGQKLTETNLNNVVTEYEYADAWGNLTEVVQDPGMGHLNRTTQMTYDAAGRVLASTDPKSQSSSFTYNGVGQPLVATLPDETVTYTYGGNGRTATVTDDRGTTTISYETGNDRVASVQDPVTGTVSYTYTETGQRDTMSLPGGGTWEYHYSDEWGTLPSPEPDKISPMLLEIEDENGREVQYLTDVTGRLHEVINNLTYQMGAPVAFQKTEYEYDGIANNYYSRGLLAQIRNTYHVYDPCLMDWTSQVLVQNDYTYSTAGNRLTNTLSDNNGPIRTEEYGYDALNRLTGVDYDDGTVQSYTFDPMGNRLSKTENMVTESYTYNNANMLLTRGAGSYTNDANGNTLTGGGRTNTWDGENRLTQCVTGTDTSSFVYGSDGLRRQATVNSTVTDYILDGQSVVRERQGSANVATYLQGLRGSEYRRNDSTGAVRWYLYDGLGSVLVVPFRSS